MNICYQYGIKWRYEINHTKCGDITVDESKAQHFQSMNDCEWKLGDENEV